jgi:hypothetical protein
LPAFAVTDEYTYEYNTQLLDFILSLERSNVYEGPQKSVAIKATNPFVVLTQGFDDIAGKPLFERNVPPRK